MNPQEPGQWLSAAAGAVMFVVVCACSAGIAAPWWTELQQPSSNVKVETEASLWLTLVRTEETLDRSTLNCEESCDITRLGSTEIRENETRWFKVCSEATDEELKTRCSKLWAIRVSMLVAFLFALLYSAAALLALCGGRRGSSVRFPADCGLLLGFGCFLGCAVAIGISVTLDMKLKLDGVGFYCALVSLIVCIPGIMISFLNKLVAGPKPRKVVDMDYIERPQTVRAPMQQVKPMEMPREERPASAPLDAWSP